MKNNYPAIFVLFALALISCKSQNVNNQQMEYPKNEEANSLFFIIGSGGGFTGKYNQFKVYDTGKVKKLNEATETYETYTEIEKELITDYFTELEALNISERKFDHPGNMTFFIQVMLENELHTIKWGDIKYPINNAIELYYEKVMTEIYKKER